MKDEGKLRAFVSDLDDDAGLKRKRARTAADPGLDKATFQWFAQKSVNTPISGVLLQGQAVKFHQQMRPDGPEFVASNGWLHRFKKRHGIGCVGINGEIKSADTGAAQEFIPELEKYIMDNNYTDMQIYNADESGLYYRILPSRTLALKRNKATAQQGLKVIKDRVTLLFACNRAGTHKLQPLMIRKFNAPRCFHHINRSTLPLAYTHSKKAWMTSYLFSEWFHKTFVPAVRRELKSHGMEPRAVLLLDNCPAHPPAHTLCSKDGKIHVKYLPPNTTSLCQPLDQGIIACFKAHYRKNLVRNILDEDTQVTAFLKAFTLKDAMYVSSKAWKAVTQTCIRNCWNKGLPRALADSDDEEEETDFHGFMDPAFVQAVTAKLPEELEEAGSVEQLMDAWSSADNDCPIAQELTEEEIVEGVLGEEEEEEEPVDPEEPAQDPNKVNNAQALKSAECLMLYYEQNGMTLQTYQMQPLVREARRRVNETQKQGKISDFFNVGRP